jgi:hypothetical protein
MYILNGRHAKGGRCANVGSKLNLLGYQCKAAMERKRTSHSRNIEAIVTSTAMCLYGGAKSNQTTSPSHGDHERPMIEFGETPNASPANNDHLLLSHKLLHTVNKAVMEPNHIKRARVTRDMVHEHVNRRSLRIHGRWRLIALY